MRFILAADGSPGAARALDFLFALPLSAADHVTVVTVGEGPLAREIAERARARLWTRVPVAVELRGGLVADTLQRAALECAVDLMVVGSRGLGAFRGALLGSVARALARNAPTPVLVVRGRGAAPRRVMVAVDDSDEARAALALLARLPLPTESAVTRIDVRSESGSDLAWRVIERAAATDADLVVLGSRGQTQGAPLLSWSVTDDVLSHAHCAVLVAKPPPSARRVAERTGLRGGVLVPT